MGILLRRLRRFLNNESLKPRLSTRLRQRFIILRTLINLWKRVSKKRAKIQKQRAK